MDANTILIDIMHNPCLIPGNKMLRITKWCKVGLCDDVPVEPAYKFRASDQRRSLTWSIPAPNGKRKPKVFNWVAVINNPDGECVIIDLRDVFIADEL